MAQSTQLLNPREIRQRIDRIAFQVYEDNSQEPELILAGIANSGFTFSRLLKDAIEKICPIPVRLYEIRLNKEKPTEFSISPELKFDQLNNKVVILADDVLNSGKTLIYSLRPFLGTDLKKIRTVLLVNRDHKRYPVEADFVGITLSTTLRENIRVELEPGKEGVYLE
jgi:pyrimidine operon attenuation protein / uracil phosphoribosyltransferase